MSAANTDLVRNAAPNFATTLANSMLISDVSLTLQAATGLPTATAITLVIDATDPVSGAATPSLKEIVTGTLSGTTVSNLLRGQDGTSAQGHASGANVVMWITANLWNDFQTSFLANHTQLGTPITNFPLTSPKVTTGINDSNNNKVLGITATSSAVNQVNVADAAANNAPTISVTGTDTNINLVLKGKGTGAVDLATPYKFSVYRNAAASTTLTSSETTVTVFDTKVYDTGSNFSISTGLFTAPAAGFYLFNTAMSMASVTSGIVYYVALIKNGVLTARSGRGISSATANYSPSLGIELQLSANDTVGIAAVTASSTFSLEVGGVTTWFTGSLRSLT